MSGGVDVEQAADELASGLRDADLATRGHAFDPRRSIRCVAERKQFAASAADRSDYSSGSSRCPIDVEPTRSQNSSVRRRFSPSGHSARLSVSASIWWTMMAGAGDLDGSLRTGAPHSLQNLAPAAMSAAHSGHGATTGTRQLGHEASEGLSVASQLGQRFMSPCLLSRQRR